MRNKLIVIIDDEEDLLDLMEYNFSKEGFKVKAFSRAKKAIDFMGKKKPDMILCDWMMPEMNGLELFQYLKLRDQLGGIPFVMVTCRTENSAVSQAFSLGVTEYIKKPIPIRDLISKVSSLMDNPPARA